MPTGTDLTDGQVRSIFALRAEGKQIKAIADTMGCATAVVSRVLARKTYSKVDISTNVLDAIAGHTFRSYKKRGAYKKKKKVKDTRSAAATLDDLNLTAMNPAMPQAMKSADPDYSMAPKVIADAAAKHIAGSHAPEMTTGVACGYEPPKPAQPVKLVGKTKAQALMDVLGDVQHCNELRQRVSRLRLDAVRIEAEAKSTEDATFEQMAALTKHGFTPEFLSSLLSESGLCSDGKFDVE